MLVLSSFKDSQQLNVQLEIRIVLNCFVAKLTEGLAERIATSIYLLPTKCRVSPVSYWPSFFPSALGFMRKALGTKIQADTGSVSYITDLKLSKIFFISLGLNRGEISIQTNSPNYLFKR